MNVRVLKVGGRNLGDPVWLSELAGHLAHVRDPIVVVHGGGPEVSALMGRLGVPVAWSGGRRVTPPEALDVAVMVLSGRTNKRIVSALVGAGVDAIGLSGEDGGLLVAEPVEGGSLGRVGQVVRVRTELLHRLLAMGLTPVISPISRGTDGDALNVNADDAAAAVAVALDASELLFLTDVDHVHDGASGRSELSSAEAVELIEAGIARDGMRVKLEAAVRALQAGCRAVRIGPLGMLTGSATGTVVRGVAAEVAA